MISSFVFLMGQLGLSNSNFGNPEHETRTRTRAEFGIGWKAFVQDNNLKVGDVCVLELINNIEVAFKVAIFRDAKDRNCPLWNGKE
jgi:hypothetical protein